MHTKGKHKNYEILNLVGYGLAKFDLRFARRFGFKTKTSFYENIVQLGICETTGTIKNRQDLFDPFFDNGRRGWWQKGGAYLHRKTFIDSLFGSLDVDDFAKVAGLYIQESGFAIPGTTEKISPFLKTKFKQLQLTGMQAELFFMRNFYKVGCFRNGILTDARMFGDGYDFQIDVTNHFFLAEVKGLMPADGGIRMTGKEFKTARKYKNNYSLVVVKNLSEAPKMITIFNPADKIDFTKRVTSSKQTHYHTNTLKWR